jgi:predicted transposase YdaD
MTYGERLEERGRAEGRQEGREEGRRALLRELLEAKFGVLDEASIARIETADASELQRWAQRLLTARDLDETLAP